MRSRGDGIGLAVALIVLLAPLARASEPLSGVLDLASPITFTGTTTATSSNVRALLAPDLSRGISLHVSAQGSLAHICDMTWESGDAQTPLRDVNVNAPARSDCHDERDLTLDASGPAPEARNYVGFYLDPAEGDQMNVTFEGNALTATFDASHSFTSRDATRSTPSDPKQNEPYVVMVDQPVFVLTGQAKITGTFSGSLKIHGPTTITTSPSGSQQYQTAQTNRSGALSLVTAEWLYVTLQNATFTLETDSPILAGLASLDAATQGSIEFSSKGGHLASTDFTYPSTFQDARLAGSLAARLSAQPTGAVLGLGGMISETSLQGTRVATGPIHDSRLLTGLGTVVATGAGAAGVALFTRYGLALRQRRAKELASAALFALARDDYARAVLYARMARFLVPHDPRPWQHEAYARWHLGDAQRSLDLYERAMRLSHDGTPALEAARLLDAQGASPEEVERWATRALDLSPDLVLELGRGEFARLAHGPGWNEAMARAWSRSKKGGARPTGAGPKQP